MPGPPLTFHLVRGLIGHVHRLCTVLLFCSALGVSAQEARFTIFKGDDAVGSIRASRSVVADHTSYLVTSAAELRVIWMQEMSTMMAAEYDGSLLTSCNATTMLNGDMRDSSRMWTAANGKMAYVHPKAPIPMCSANTWTTARMYYEEPVGQTRILVESVLRDCPLQRIAPGIYELTLPNNDRNRYLYVDGRLMEVQVDRLLMDLVFRRS